MMADAPELVVSRVIAAVDATAGDRCAVAKAVDLAARLRVEVCGLFVEDINLVRVAELPVARHMTWAAAPATPFGRDELEREMSRLAERAATELRAAATRLGVKSSFRIVRGIPAEELMNATALEDLLVVGIDGSSGGISMPLKSALHNAAQAARRTTFHAVRGSKIRRPVVMLSAGSRLIERTMSVAMRLAANGSRELTILSLGSAGDAEELGHRVAALLSAHGWQGRLEPVGDLSRLDPVRLMQAGDTLVLPVDVASPRDEAHLRRLISDRRYDTLVVC